MSDTAVTIPIGLQQQGETQPAQPTAQERPASGFQNGQYVPPSKRTTLHNTRLGVALARQTEANAPAPVPQQSQAEALGRELDSLRTTINVLAQHQLGNAPRGYDARARDAGTLEQLMAHNRHSDAPYDGQQYDGGSNDYGGAPNPDDFDLWDDVGRLQYRNAFEGRVKEAAQLAVEADRAARQLASDEERYRADIAATNARFGRDANFEDVRARAAQIVIASGGKVLLEDAYLQVSNEMEARRGRRERSTFLPKDITTLGGIERYRRQTGRIK